MAVIGSPRSFAADAGLTAGFESAASSAALDRLLSSGTFHRGSRVLLQLTSSHLVSLGRRSVPGW